MSDTSDEKPVTIPALLHHLDLTMKEMTAEMRTLGEHIQDKPSKLEVMQARRRIVSRVISGTILLVFISAYIQDAHLENCGAGSRAETVIDAVRAGKVTSLDDFNRIADENQAPNMCDFMFPLHTHKPEKWPTASNIFGLVALWAVLLTCTWGLFTRRWNIKD